LPALPACVVKLLRLISGQSVLQYREQSTSPLTSSSSTGASNKLLLDEAGFEQLLAAAYVLQQHNDRVQAKKFPPENVPIQSEIVRKNGHNKPEQDSALSSSSNRLSDPKPIVDSLARNCRVCGRTFREDEVFCGNCSMPRVAGGSSEDLQSKWASMWYIQQAQDALQGEDDSSPALRQSEPDYPAAAEFNAPSNGARLWGAGAAAVPPESEKLTSAFIEPAPVFRSLDEDEIEQSNTKFKISDTKVGQSYLRHPIRLDVHAIEARLSGLLENLQARVRTFQVRIRTSRRNAAVAIACLVLVVILAISALSPQHSSSQPQLSWFSSLLVNLGLAEVPSRAPVYVGNPDAPVWVDVHTALYYCKGSDLYGKTPGGRFSTQRDAQEDQFESASRLACQ
jgi:hypothetical protein